MSRQSAPDATIEEAAQEMRDGDFGLVPVAEDEELLGVITDRDIAIRAVAEGKDPSTLVREIVSEEVVWASEDDSVEDAARIMSDHPDPSIVCCRCGAASGRNCIARRFCSGQCGYSAGRRGALRHFKTILSKC